MKPFRVTGWVCALALWAADAGLLQAAWCNVFQVCCGSCRKRQPVAAGYYVAQAAPACPQPACPQPVCTTRYTMRCYYQPVTTYQSKTYYEPVTTYRTSYYYEPVTSYSYSCYYDPCSCTTQQVATPVTSYKLRAQSCPVQSWVQRCCSVPVTTYQKSFYWEPVTSCCTPVNPCCNNGALTQAAPAVTVTEPPLDNRQPTTDRPPNVRQENGGDAGQGIERYYGPPSDRQPSSFRQQVPSSQRQPPPVVRLDRIVSIPVTRFEGQVVHRDNTPRSNAQLRFVSLSRRGPQYPVRANSAGRFQVTLTSGTWLVYINTPDGRQVFHSKINVNGDGTRRVMLVSR